MERYRLSEQERAILEGLQQPYAMYQLVDKRVATLILSEGFCELFGYTDKARAYHDMDTAMYKDVHPDDVARISNAAVQFATGAAGYEVIYRTRGKREGEYRVIHAFGKHTYAPTGEQLAHVWYVDEGPYVEGAASEGQERNQSLSNALHEESLLKSSRFDALTGLPTMSYFFELAEAWKRSTVRSGGHAVLLSMLAYLIKPLRENVITSNLLLALFTSLLVTVFTMVADIIVSYQTHKNDQYLEDLYQFGIGTFRRDKKEMLQSMLAECDKTVWISGYRLILTRNIRKDILAAIERGATVISVVCPPWSEAFRMVYGDNEKVMDNYLECIHTVNQGRIEHGADGTDPSREQFWFVFVDKPIFSDTYRIDQNLVTGPYMHNRDPDYNRMMATDFFSYDIVRQSELYSIVDEEYKTLMRDSKWMLCWDRFEAVYEKIKAGDYREEDKKKLLFSVCREIKDEDRAAMMSAVGVKTN